MLVAVTVVGGGVGVGVGGDYVYLGVRAGESGL